MGTEQAQEELEYLWPRLSPQNLYVQNLYLMENNCEWGSWA